MRIGILFAFVDYHRRGSRSRISMQPQIGPLIAGLLPDGPEIEVINETWAEPDWSRDFDLLFISSMHSDFDRARQISHYWRRRGAKTVYGGALATTHPHICQPYFDSVVVGEPEDTIPALYQDFCRGALRPRYFSNGYAPQLIKTPRYELLVGKALAPFALEATRGCPFFCDFCVVSATGADHRTRPISRVVHDIRAGQEALAGSVAGFKTRLVGFLDNNLGGNLPYLRELCTALKPMRLQWYGAVTFNVISQPRLVETMAESGCKALFVGLESFNAESIKDMHKFQNVVAKTRASIELCKRHGILVMSGMMVSPLHDGLEYLSRLPHHLSDCGLHVPAFLCFECPFPGTPFFQRLAQSPEPAFLPGALLRDFTGYTLVVRPRKSSTDEFLTAYRHALTQIYSWRRRARKLGDDLPKLLLRGNWFAALVDVVDMMSSKCGRRLAPGRSFIAGTDTPPPETVPFRDDDFRSDAERDRILSPTVITDAVGRPYPDWVLAERSGSSAVHLKRSASMRARPIANADKRTISG